MPNKEQDDCKQVDKQVVLAVPSVGEEKMQAICELSRAVAKLASALAGVSTHVEVHDCYFKNGLRLETTDEITTEPEPVYPLGANPKVRKA